jgi:hypothetical protein
MVWPILISVAVTPRISAAVEAADHVSTASALSAPNLVTKRIDVLPIYFRHASIPASWQVSVSGESAGPPTSIMME